MKTIKPTLCAVFALMLVSLMSVQAGRSADRIDSATKAVRAAMGELKATKGDENLLTLTNAYYGRIDGHSAEAYRDAISETTGCTSGKRNFLDVHSAFDKPLWFALFRKDTGKLVFTKWSDGTFKNQIIDASPESILTLAGWKKASEGLIGGKGLFSVVSISLAWAEGAAWPIIKTAGFHDHLCPGVNIGYLAHVYLEKKLPLEKGERYLFFGALPKCYMDTLQVMYNATMGKQRAFGVTMSKEQLAKYRTNGAVPSIIAVKVNKKRGTCEGVVLGHSWGEIMQDLGTDVADFSPKGGPSNPVFFLTRAKACRKMAQIKLDDKMKWLKELRRFSGDSTLANKICNAGGDPYAVVWAR